MSEPGKDFQAALAAGIAAHRAGDLAGAELAYRRMLALHPDHPDALHLLGQIERARGNLEAGLALVQRAVQFHAAPSYLTTAGSILGALGRNQEALAAFDRALLAEPRKALLLYNRANALKRLERHHEAVAGYRQVIAVDPQSAEALHNLGATLNRLARYGEALEPLRAADKLKPGDADTLTSIGAALAGLQRVDEASPYFERALALDPGNLEAHSGMAACWFERGDGGRAEAACMAILAKDPQREAVKLQLANQWARTGRLAEALPLYDQLIEARPDFAEARFNRAQILLRQGQWRQGWIDYEYRLEVPELIVQKNTGLPPWRGQALAGKTLLMVGEQGLGDTLQFLRFVPMVQARGGSCVLWPQAPLAPLLKSGFAACRVIGALAELEGADFSVNLPSLPHWLEMAGPPAPEAAPYLTADPRRIERWRAWLGPAGKGPAQRLRIGVAWQGSRAYLADKFRSFPPASLGPLAEIDGVDLVSLHLGVEQVLAGIDWIRQTPPEFDADGAFLDTAALMQSLDLMICADTALAHLAGALARPSWLALDSVGDWRWPHNAAQSPWYRTARIYRQQRRGDWNGVFAAMAADLKQMVVDFRAR